MDFNKKLIELVKSVRQFEIEYHDQIASYEIENNFQEAQGSLDDALKQVTYAPEEGDGDDTLAQHQAMEGRKELFV